MQRRGLLAVPVLLAAMALGAPAANAQDSLNMYRTTVDDEKVGPWHPQPRDSGLPRRPASHLGACAAQSGNWRRSPTVTSARAAQRARRRPALPPPRLHFAHRRWSQDGAGR